MCLGSGMKRFSKKGYVYYDTTIDWPLVVATHNCRYRTNYKNEKDVYLKLLLSPGKLAERLCVSIGTIYNRMDFYGIPRSHKRGGSNNTARPKKDAFLAIPEGMMKDMTAKMLAVRLRVHVNTVYRFAIETGRAFKRRAANRVKGE